MVFAVAMLTCLVASALWALINWTPVAGGILLAFAVLWLPANNHELEGRTLLTVGGTHGFTQSDVVGLSGWSLAMIVLLRWAIRSAHGPARSERVGAVMLVGLGALAFGAFAAYSTG